MQQCVGRYSVNFANLASPCAHTHTTTHTPTQTTAAKDTMMHNVHQCDQYSILLITMHDVRVPLLLEFNVEDNVE